MTKTELIQTLADAAGSDRKTSRMFLEALTGVVEKQVKKRVGIVVTPTKTASWDHSKMSSLPGGGNKP